MFIRSELDEFEKKLLHYDKKGIFEIADAYALREGFPLFAHEVLVPALTAIGEAWEAGDVSLSQIYLAGKITDALFDKHLDEQAAVSIPSPKLGIVTLEDHHALGKRIVTAAIRAKGYQLHDLGIGVGYREAAEKVNQEGIEVLLVSVLMYPSALKVEKLKNELEKMNSRTKVLVGGAPFNFDSLLWKKVGADAMGASAAAGVAILENWFLGF